MIKYMYCWNLAAKLEGNLSPMVLAYKGKFAILHICVGMLMKLNPAFTANT